MDNGSCLLGLFVGVVAPVEYWCITIVVGMDKEWLPFQRRPFFLHFCQDRIEVFSCEDCVAVRELKQLGQSWTGKPRGDKEHCVAQPGKRDNSDNNMQPRLGQNSDDRWLFRSGFLSQTTTESAIERCHAVEYRC